jgi:hypothetical protein
MVDAQPARDHIIALRAQSMGAKVIARLSGLPAPTVGGVMWGREGRQPPKRIQRRTADAILAVQFSFDELLPSAHVDVTPYRRRLQALACLGWTWKALADELGMGYQQLSAIVSPRARTKVEVATARRIRDLYDRLWSVTPIAGDAHQAARIRITKRRAASEGWVAPLGWDDIDDLTENPEQGNAEDEPGWVVDELAHLHDLGESPVHAAAAIGQTRSSLTQIARRYKRPDLARWIDDRHERKAA